MLTKTFEGRNNRVIPLMIEHQFVENNPELNDPKKREFFEHILNELGVDKLVEKMLEIDYSLQDSSGWDLYLKKKKQLVEDMIGARLRVTVKVEYENFIN